MRVRTRVRAREYARARACECECLYTSAYVHECVRAIMHVCVCARAHVRAYCLFVRLFVCLCKTVRVLTLVSIGVCACMSCPF